MYCAVCKEKATQLYFGSEILQWEGSKETPSLQHRQA